MVAEAYVAVDVEKACRQWARDGGFVTFFGVNNNGTFPQVVVQRVGGPDDEARIQWDVWGGTKQQAAATAADLATGLSALARYAFDGIRLHGAQVDGVRWVPDPDSDRARYIVDTVVTATAI
jgi:hypothetical protein